MPQGLIRKRVAKQLGQAQVPGTPPQESDNSSVTSAHAENVQKPSKMELIENASTSGTSLSTLPVPPVHVSHEERYPEGNNIIVNAPKSPSRGLLRLNEALQQEASDLWAKAYNKLPIECKQDLEHVDNTYSSEPEKLEALKQLLEHAMEAKGKNIASQWKLKWGGKEVNVREKAERLVGWITRFKEVVDIAVQYDPVHAALPWAGVRLILNACTPQLYRKPIHFSCQITDSFSLRSC